MIMTRTRREPSDERGLVGLIARLNRRLLPWIGPPPLGPYTEVPEAEALAEKSQAICPICRELMSLHEVDRSGEWTMIYHPAPR